MKLECIHADTCLPDYWGGHSLAHVRVLAYRRMTLDEIKDALKSEINEGAVAGHCELAQLLSDMPPPDVHAGACEEAHEAALAAVDAIEPAEPSQTSFFMDLDEPEDEVNDVGDNQPYAFFVFREID